ncbi:MAG: Na+/H+ antiporter NhaA [Acidimicrobiales bacterium]
MTATELDDQDERPRLPTWLTSERPMARTIGRPMQRFLHVEAAGGIVLLVATVAALLWANLDGSSYTEFWHAEISLDVAGFHLEEDLLHWVNDGLMAVFFFVVGLEIKREWEVGELVDRRAALLPAIGAAGGMILPASMYVAFNVGSDTVNGWGIPMATDIAFALGIIALVGHRVPSTLKVFLLTLAIVDDIGAIVVIAIFYSAAVAWEWLALAGLLIATTYILKRIRVWYLPVYVILAGGIWLATFESGVHATLAGVILGIITPTHPLNPDVTQRQVEAAIADPALDQTTSAVEAARLINESVPVGSRLIRAIHPWTSFVIIPIFALANAGIELTGSALADAATSSVTIGIAVGLVAGKTLGISGAVAIAIRLGVARLPERTTMTQVVGVCAVAGIGFTVSLFIGGLAFEDPAIVSQAKIGILAASVAAALLGAAILVGAGRRPPSDSVASPASSSPAGSSPGSSPGSPPGSSAGSSPRSPSGLAGDR